MRIRFPDLPPLSGPQGGGSLLPYWSEAQDITFKATPPDLLGYYNVRLFGAVGDGITDDTAAVQGAINAAAAAGGGVVWFPAGVYVHTGLTISTRAIVLDGGTRTHNQTAFGANLLYNGPATGNWLSISGACEGCIIKYIHFRKAPSLTLSGGNAIDITGSTRVFLDNVKIAEPWNGIYIHDINNIVVRESEALNYSGAFGLKCFGNPGPTTNGITLDNVVVSSTGFLGSGFELEGNVATVYFYQCYANGVKYGLRTLASGGSTPAFLEADRFTVERASDRGFDLVNFRAVSFSNCRVLTSGLTAQGGSPWAAFALGAGGDGLNIFFNCRASSCGRMGWLISYNSSRTDLINCTAAHCSQNTTNTDSGMLIDNGVGGLQIIGGVYGGDNFGHITPTRQKYGIELGSAVLDVTISDVDVRGNTTSGIGAAFGFGGAKISTTKGWVTENSGQAVGVTPDGNGNVTILHGLASAPTYANVMLLGDQVNNGVEVQAVGANGIIARIYDEATGADVTSGTFTIMWHGRTAQA